MTYGPPEGPTHPPEPTVVNALLVQQNIQNNVSSVEVGIVAEVGARHEAEMAQVAAAAGSEVARA